MALILVGAPSSAYKAKGGCGLKYKLEEDDYILSAGTASLLEISFGFSAALTVGDTFKVYGVLFTITAVSSSNITDIPITDTNVQIAAAVQGYPKFLFDYTVVSGASNSTSITNNKIGVDSSFEYEFNVTNAGAIELKPASVPTQGSDNEVKDDYSVLLDIVDSSGNKICQDPINMDLSVFATGDNAACFDVEDIIANLPYAFTAPPLPRQTVVQGLNKPTNFDENFLAEFELIFYNQYKDSTSLSCGRITDSLVSATLRVANVLQPIDYQTTLGIYSDKYKWTLLGRSEFITAMPADYEICKTTPFELRYDLNNDFIINILGGQSFLEVIVNYADGTNEQSLISIEDPRDGIHVANISFSSTAVSDNSTIQLTNFEKTIENIYIRVYFLAFGSPETVAERFVYIDNSSNGRCCGGCDKTFYFISSVGNNDVLSARCESDIDFEVEFNNTCREVKCGGELYWGIPQYDGGRIDTALSKREKPYRVYFESSSPDYLEEFLAAPVKYVYENDSVYRIYPTASSFKIYQKNFKTKMEFTYVKSISPIRKSLSK